MGSTTIAIGGDPGVDGTDPGPRDSDPVGHGAGPGTDAGQNSADPGDAGADHKREAGNGCGCATDHRKRERARKSSLIDEPTSSSRTIVCGPKQRSIHLSRAAVLRRMGLVSQGISKQSLKFTCRRSRPAERDDAFGNDERNDLQCLIVRPAHVVPDVRRSRKINGIDELIIVLHIAAKRRLSMTLIIPRRTRAHPRTRVRSMQEGADP